MSILDNLEVDKMTVDTKLAESYFKEHNCTFQCVANHESGCNLKYRDGYNTFVTNEEKCLEDFDKSLPQYMTVRDNVKLSELSKNIEESADLFAQIDHLIRVVPLDQVKKFDISLLSRNLLYSSLNQYIYNIPNKLIVDYHAPLATLGFVAQMLATHGKALIISSVMTSAACYLFVDLCRKVGLTNVYLLFVNKIPEEPATGILNINSIKEIKSGCVAAITEHADLESAVAALLEAPSKHSWNLFKHPWKLSKILVQESVYELFKKSMRWRCGGEAKDSIAKLCSNFYTHNGKKFLVDYTGVDNGDVNKGILVEAYRTTNELLSLVATKNSLFMSLWTNDIAEANEICHHPKSPSTIWLNKYGGFDGPAVCSQAVYRTILARNVQNKTDTDTVRLVLEKRKLWLRNTVDERLHILRSALLEKLDEEPYTEWITRLYDWNAEDLVRADPSTICICKTEALPVTFLSRRLFSIKRINDIGFTVIKGLAKGTAFVIDDGINNSIFEHFASHGAPVLINKQSNSSYECSDIIDSIKVVYIN